MSSSVVVATSLSVSPTVTYLALGTNLGDRDSNLRAALQELAQTPGLELLRCTPFRESEPWGDPEQPAFLNAVAEARTTLQPHELLAAVKAIEVRLGRTPARRWGPRVIDIDILTWGRLRLDTPELTLPHPHILERPFVWQPLAELAPELVEELRHAALSL